MTIRPSPNITPVKAAPAISASPSSFSSSSSEGQTSDEEISDLLISPRQAATFPLPPSPDESTFPQSPSANQPSHLAQVAAQPLTPIAPARLPTSLARRHSLREKVLIRSAVKAHHNRGLVRSASLGSSPSRPLFAGSMVRSQSTGSVIAGDDDSDSSSDEEVPLVSLVRPQAIMLTRYRLRSLRLSNIEPQSQKLQQQKAQINLMMRKKSQYKLLRLLHRTG